MRNELFDQALDEILRRDATYPRGAYELLPPALDFTVRRCRGADGTMRHVTGQELSVGFRDYMLETYGPFAWDLLEAYRLKKTSDIGALVYRLIEVGAFGKTEQDTIEDFNDVYDFKAAFYDPFIGKALRK